jgi:hypothetical protein
VKKSHKALKHISSMVCNRLDSCGEQVAFYASPPRAKLNPSARDTFFSFQEERLVQRSAVSAQFRALRLDPWWDASSAASPQASGPALLLKSWLKN